MAKRKRDSCKAPYSPTQAAIARECSKIQAGWAEETELSRRTGPEYQRIEAYHATARLGRRESSVMNEDFED